MKKSFLILLIVIIALVISAGCVQNEFKNSRIVAVEKNGVTICNISLLNDTMKLPLSHFTEELQIVKLEMSHDAVVKDNHVLISDNYILVKGGSWSSNEPSKLFSKDGKFITNIGNWGHGPGEYMLVYDEVIDEKNNRIYLLPWTSDKILVFDLKGNVLEHIRLPMNVPKGKFFVDPNGETVTVFSLPFTGSPYIVWTQNITGEVINGIEPGNLTVVPDYSNEVMAGKNTSDIQVFMFTFDHARIDKLYHYDTKKNKLVAKFLVDYSKKKNLAFPCYSELPNHFIGSIAAKELKTDYGDGIAGAQVVNHRYFIIEKSSLKGNYFKLQNDYLGNLEIDWPLEAISNGYYAKNYDPGDLLEELENALKNNKLSAEMRKKVTELKNSITDKDNNYILFAKLKK